MTINEEYHDCGLLEQLERRGLILPNLSMQFLCLTPTTFCSFRTLEFDILEYES